MITLPKDEDFLKEISYTPKIDVKELIGVRAHFGHPVSRWNPKMREYIFGERGGFHIINVQKTAELMTIAMKFLWYVASKGGNILFVGTKSQAKEVVKEGALECGMPYIVERWLGGTLTNFQTIKMGIEKYNSYMELIETGKIYELYTKKEANSIKRRIEKMSKNYEGIRNLKFLPDAVFLIGVREERTAIHEILITKIPVVAPVDTNCDPTIIDFPFPGNDDAITAIKYYVSKAVEAIKDGKRFYEETKPPTEEEKYEEKIYIDKFSEKAEELITKVEEEEEEEERI